jgi:hypothetical protein
MNKMRTSEKTSGLERATQQKAGFNINFNIYGGYSDKEELEVYLPGVKIYYPLKGCGKLLDELSAEKSLMPEENADYIPELRRALDVLAFIKGNENYIQEILVNDIDWLRLVIKNFNSALASEPATLPLDKFSSVFENVAYWSEKRAYADNNEKKELSKILAFPEENCSQELLKAPLEPTRLPEPTISPNSSGLETKIDNDPDNCRKKNIHIGLARCNEDKKRLNCSRYFPSSKGEWHHYCRY